MKRFIATFSVGLFMINAWHAAHAQDATALMKEAHLNYYYAGDDGKARVTMTQVDQKGNTKVKEFTIVRKDIEDGGEQLYFTYFKSPSDIKRMTFMVKKHIDRADDRSLYIPAIDLVKKIAASDKASSFVGSDFTYEDVSGRLWTEDRHELLGEEKLRQYMAFKIKSMPKAEDYFAHKLTFIDKETRLPLREEYYNKQGKAFRIFTAEKIETIQGIPTITLRKMQNLAKSQHTLIEFTDIEYNVNIKKKYFSERYLKKPNMALR